MPSPASDPERDDARAPRELVEALIFDYLERAEVEGAGVLDELCRAHAECADELRQRVRLLENAGLLGASSAPASFPERLGDFRLRSCLGGGGMGVVYVAEQESLRREVALKLIRPELLYFPGSRQRFRREVEAVAKLQHQGIVPIYTVGEDAGVPFFAMELIRGCTLGEVLASLAGRPPEELTGADLQRVLAERTGDSTVHSDVALFRGRWAEVALRIAREVAQALEHAHQRGVLHRDVKPSNVMVTPAGRVALLDFGLSSSGSDERMTRTGSVLGSLPYMAPEQLAGDRSAADARSDVYSLGASLYELLTLTLPFGASDALHVRERIVAGRPPRPIRELNASVSSDAVTVCACALEHDPARRYPSAAAFERDLQNVLDLRPIAARRASPWLRARRWSQRHPAAAVALVLGGALVFGAPSGWAVQRELARRRIEEKSREVEAANTQLGAALEDVRAQHGRAELNFQTALDVIDRLLVRLEGERLEGAPHMEELRGEVLGEAVALYRKLLDESRAEPGLRMQMARIGLKVGDLEYRLDHHAEAERAYSDARAVLESLTLDPDAGSEPMAELARSHAKLANLQRDAGEHAEAEANWTKARAILAELVEREPEDQGLRYELAVAEQDFASSLIALGRSGEAEAGFERALALAAGSGSSPNSLHLFALVQLNLADLLVLTGRDADGEDLIRDAKHAAERAAQAEPSNPDHRHLLALLCFREAELLKHQDRLPEALAACVEALALESRLAADHPRKPMYRTELAGCHAQHATLLLQSGDPDAALEQLQSALSIYTQLAAELPHDVEKLRHLAGTRSNLGEVLMTLERHEEGEEQCSLGLDAMLELRSRLADDLSIEADIAALTHNLGRSRLIRGAVREARECFERAIEHQRLYLDAYPDSSENLEAMRNHYWSLAAALCRLREHAAAVQVAEELPRWDPEPSDEYRRAAKYVSRCIPYAREDASLSEEQRAQVAEDYAQRALALLGEALARGDRELAFWREDPDLEPLRARGEFLELVAEVERGAR